MRIQFLLSAVLCIILITSCNKNENPTLQQRLDSGTSPTELLNDYPVDSFYTKEYAGGYIFHIESDGTGMVVSKEDLSATAWWGCAGNEIQGAEGIILGCTEIPLLIEKEDVAVPVFDTTTIHARKAFNLMTQ